MKDWRLNAMVAEDRWANRVQQGLLAPGTAARYLRVFEAFCRFAIASGVADAGGVTPELCRRFLAASLRGDPSPTGSTAAVRLAAIRHAFDCLVEAGYAVDNPTFCLRVDRRPPLAIPCPLTLDEAQRLLSSGCLFPTDTLRPAAVALALAGATHVEIARSVVADVDDAIARVHIGSGLGSERTIALETAARAAVTMRISAQRREWRRRKQPWAPESVPLAMHRPVTAYTADHVAPTVSMNLSRAFKRAGITRVGVRPRSCREYAANAVYARTGRVEDVARHLGMTSLDAAYRLLDEGWLRQWAHLAKDLGVGR